MGGPDPQASGGLAGIGVSETSGSHWRNWPARLVLAALLFGGESREEVGEAGLGVGRGGTCRVLRGAVAGETILIQGRAQESCF